MKRDYLVLALNYCYEVRTGKRIAGMLEKKACKRFLDDLSRSSFDVTTTSEEAQKLFKLLKFKPKPDIDFEYSFDEKRAHHACFFIETCPHVKGDLARPNKDGTRNLMIMEGWQVFATLNLFGWVTPDDYRRFIYAYIEVAKKNGKSTWVAAIALYMAFIDGEMGAEVYAAATSREQANIVFGDAKAMVEASRFMRQRFGIEVTQYSILQRSTNSCFKALSQDRGGTKDGLNVHCAINDELHAHKTADMYDITTNGMASREQPLGLSITTAGSDTTGVCFRERKVVVAVLTGKSAHDRYFGMIFALDRGDDWRDEKNWAKANPNYGISVKASYLKSIYEKCEISPASEAIFRQKHLNEWVGAIDGWIAESLWNTAERSYHASDFKNVVGFGGYDLASRVDLAAWVEMRPRLEDGEVHWYLFAHSYINERVMSQKVVNGENRNDEYAVWEQQEFLTVTDGQTTDFKRIEQDICDRHVASPFYQVGHDPYHAAEVTANLLDFGIEVVEIKQTTQFLDPAMRWLEVLLLEGRLHHDGNPLFKWAVLNVVVKPDAKDLIFPRKESPAKKIDPAVGMFNAASVARHYDDESVFELVPGEGGDTWDADDYLQNMVVVRRR